MSNELFTFLVGLAIGILLTMGIIGTFREHTAMYKQGQIDALNGKIYYELQKQENGTTDWVFVKEGAK